LKIPSFVLTEFAFVTDRRTDRRTYRQTPHDVIGRTCKASRGKNSVKIIARVSDVAS